MITTFSLLTFFCTFESFIPENIIAAYPMLEYHHDQDPTLISGHSWITLGIIVLITMLAGNFAYMILLWSKVKYSLLLLIMLYGASCFFQWAYHHASNNYYDRNLGKYLTFSNNQIIQPRIMHDLKIDPESYPKTCCMDQ
ncbi:hypothetical protein ACQZV8_20040 [Magnetococcales bacterium HHB-1]